MGTPEKSVFGYECFVTYIDECTRMTCIYLIKNRGVIPDMFKLFHIHTKSMYNAKKLECYIPTMEVNILQKGCKPICMRKLLRFNLPHLYT